MIVNGNNTTIDQQPWQVIVARNGDNGCGGTIIGPTSILTAAHCVNNFTPNQIQVFAGTTFLNQRNNGQVRNVTQVITHNTWNPNTFQRDIAILRLDAPLSFNSDVQPIRFDGGTRITNPGSTATASGWGQLTQTAGQSNQLQRTTVNIVGNVDGANYATPIDLTTQMAAGGDGTGPCFGDSGGPLWVNSGGQNFLVGVISFGPFNTCSTGDDPDIYTRVSSYCGWIIQQITSFSNIISSSTAICNSQTFTISDQPSNTSITWSSSYPNGLTFGGNGVTTRQNNYNGQVTVTATISNNCGSGSISRTVQVGPPLFSSFLVNGQSTSNATICVNNFASIEAGPNDFSASYYWSQNNPNGYITNTGGSNTAFNSYSADCFYLDLQISNACGINQQTLTICTQNCFARYTVYPNPAKDFITIEFENVENAEALPDEIALLSEKSSNAITTVNVHEVFNRKAFKNGKQIEFYAKELPRGTYYLHIKNSRQKDKELDIVRIMLI